MVTWLIALLASGSPAANLPASATSVTNGPAAVAGPVLETTARARPTRRKGSQRLSALTPPDDGAGLAPTPFSFSAMEDERQRLRLGVKPGLRRARFGIDYRVALDR